MSAASRRLAGGGWRTGWRSGDHRMGSRANSFLAHRNETSAIPAHQARETMPLLPMGVPKNSPRSVSVMGVNGWYSANARRPGGIESVGTKALDRNGSSIRNMGVLLALSTVLAARPSATVSQVSAKVNAASRPMMASQATGPAVGRNPISSATPMVTTRPNAVLTMLPSTWPVSTDTRAMAMVRNRAMMPSVMSMATDTAVPWAAAATATSRMPGTT